MDHPVATAGSRPFVNSLMKNYDEGGIVASLSPIFDWRSVVSWSVIPIGVVWRRHDRMAALSVREPRSVCVSWRGCRRRCCPFIWSPFVFTCYIGAVVINSVANPSPRESTNLPCIPRPREFVCFSRTSQRETFLAFVSLSLVRDSERACVSTFVCVLLRRRRVVVVFFVVVVAIVLAVVVVFSRAKSSAVRGIVPLHNCACIALSLFYVPLCVRA